MSRITIHLDNLTDVRLRQWCAGAADPGNPYRTVDAAAVIQAMIRLSRRDPDVRGQVSNRLRLHTGGETARNAIPVDLDNRRARPPGHALTAATPGR
jgi:hypothetical protein